MISPNLQDMQKVIRLAKIAAKKIMHIYLTDLNINYKEDLSPLTDADMASQHLIYNELSMLYPDIPILSEESSDNFTLKNKNDCFWCVDPLDGTKEFIKKNDEFTVNIALIQNQKPVLGVIGVPAKNIIYAAVRGEGAFKQYGNSELKTIRVKPCDSNNQIFAVSRSHLDNQTIQFIEEHQAKVLRVGSALKLAYVAEGVADVYPRFGPTMLWDVAAGHCVIEEAGGKVLLATNQQPMVYNIDHLRNTSFIAMNNSLKKMIST